MEVYIILEHQLDEHSIIQSTKIVDVFINKEDAELYLEYCKLVDKNYVKCMMCDPCKYEIKTHKVIE